VPDHAHCAATMSTFVNIRLDQNVVNAFKSKDRGWQSRMNAALREWMREHSVAKWLSADLAPR